MELHKKEKDFKRYLALQKADKENHQAQRNLGVVELKKPVFKGWTVLIVPRKDVQQREDAEIFWTIIDICGQIGFIRNKNRFKSKDKKYQCWPYRPGLNTLCEYEFQKLTPPLKKYFSLRLKKNPWQSNEYYCNLPYFFWDFKLEKSYITHTRLIDEILLQEENEIDKEMSYLSYKHGFGNEWRHPSKKYVQKYNRCYRAETKHILLNFIKKGIEQEYPCSGKHSACYDWL